MVSLENYAQLRWLKLFVNISYLKIIIWKLYSVRP